MTLWITNYHVKPIGRTKLVYLLQWQKVNECNKFVMSVAGSRRCTWVNSARNSCR